MRIAAFFAVAALAAACASTPGEPESTGPETLAALMEAVFETAPDDPDNDFRDRRVRFSAPSLPGVWLYYQLNTGAERKVYRQRVISLEPSSDGASIIQRSYRLKDEASFVDAWERPDQLAALTMDDLALFPGAGCEQVWRPSEGGWRGYVDPATCTIFSERRGADIAIEAEALLDEAGYRQTERGFDAEGTQLFGGAAGEYIALYRR